MKVEKSIYSAMGNINIFHRSDGKKIKSRPKFEGGAIKLDLVCFDCSNGNHANNYSQGMRKADEYFVQTSTYGKDIQSKIMKRMVKILTIPVKVATGNNEVGKILLGKELLE